jgi:hypothetical protein
MVPLGEILPCVGFDKQPHILYVYVDDDWTICSDEHIAPIIDHIFKSLRKLLIDWESSVKNTTRQCDIEDKYARYVKCIMGPSVGYVELCRQFRRALYDVAKLNLHNIIEYEFTT